jgi:phosphonoacetate hydrolase
VATSCTESCFATGTMVEVSGRTYAVPKRPTVIIVVDGFDPGYLDRGFVNGTLPTMQSFRKAVWTHA